MNRLLSHCLRTLRQHGLPTWLAAAAWLALSPCSRLAQAADTPPSRPNSNAPKAGATRTPAKPAGKAAPESEAASDLDNQLLEGAPPAAGPMKKPSEQPSALPPSTKPGKPADEAPAGGAPEPAHEGESADGEGLSDDNPLAHIGRQMRAAQRRLESLRKSDADTKELQEEIVAELTNLIDQLEKQQSSQQSSSNSQRQQQPSASERKSVKQPGAAPNSGRSDDRRPAKESNERAGKGEKVRPTAEQMRGLMKDVWGQLPSREREQMLQSPPEQFLPKYEVLLEKYYKRLAEEQKHRP